MADVEEDMLAEEECIETAVTVCIECFKRLSMALPPTATPRVSVGRLTGSIHVYGATSLP